MIEWLQSTWLFGDTMGHVFVTFIWSLTPMIGVRAAVPYGIIVAGLPWYIVFPVAFAGEILPSPFIILFIKRIFAFMKKWGKFGAWVQGKEEKALKKSEKVLKYKSQGLFFFGALPLPGTGGWMSSLIAALLNMKLKDALPPIIAGAFVATALLVVITMTGAEAFRWIISS